MVELLPTPGKLTQHVGYLHMSITRHGLTLAVLLSLAACGGRLTEEAQPTPGAQETPEPVVTRSAAGLWTGQIASNRTVTGLVLSNGTYYVIYSEPDDPDRIGGLVQGSGTVSGDTFTSSDAKDFNVEGAGVLSATLDGTVATKDTISGNVRYLASTALLSITYDPDFEVTPSLSTLAGTYNGTVASSEGGRSGSVTVSETGEVSGAIGECTFSGSTSPRADGNAYDLTVTFAPSSCVFPDQTFTGIAYYDSRTERLYAAATNGARSDALLFFGAKPEGV